MIIDLTGVTTAAEAQAKMDEALQAIEVKCGYSLIMNLIAAASFEAAESAAAHRLSRSIQEDARLSNGHITAMGKFEDKPEPEPLPEGETIESWQRKVDAAKKIDEVLAPAMVEQRPEEPTENDLPEGAPKPLTGDYDPYKLIQLVRSCDSDPNGTNWVVAAKFLCLGNPQSTARPLSWARKVAAYIKPMPNYRRQEFLQSLLVQQLDLKKVKK